MTELQAAVGIGQLRKLGKIVDNRRKRAALLTSLTDDIQSTVPPMKKSWVFHTYWHYCIRINTGEFKVAASDPAAARTAEGIEGLPGYLGYPVYRYDLLQKSYGTAEFPYSCSRYGKTFEYNEGLCPDAERACKESLFLPWKEKCTEDSIQDMAKGIRKVTEYYHK